MDANAKLIWTNRALNAVAFFGFILTTVLGILAELGDIVSAFKDANLIPTKWIGIVLLISSVAKVAAKFAKTPSQAIAAAVPPEKILGTPPVVPPAPAGGA